MNSQRFATLDGLRGLAALLVLVWHALGKHPQYQPLGSAYLAVDLFFMLSGFVVAFAYEDRLRGGMTFRSFWLVRLVRLYPLYLLGTAIGALVATAWVMQAGGEPWRFKPLIGEMLLGLVLLPKPVADGEIGFPLNSPAWSLFFELVINLLYAALLPFLTTRMLVRIAIVSSVGLYAVALHYGTLNVGGGGPQMLAGLVRVICPFTIGVLLYRSWRQDGLGQVPRLGPILPAAALVLLLAGPEKGVIASLVAPTVVVFGLPIVIALGAVSLSSPRQTYWSERLGDLSYPIYAIHMPLLMVAGFVSTATGAPALTLSAVAALASIPIAWIALQQFDIPVRRFMTARIRRAQTRTPDTRAAATVGDVPFAVPLATLVETSAADRPT